MSGTIYAKVDCYSTASLGTALDSQSRIVGEVWSNLMYFMLDLYGIYGYVQPVAGNFGGANGYGFWDGLTDTGTPTFAAGPGAWMLWKFPAHANRPFDWYFYMQTLSGSVTNSGTQLKVENFSYQQPLQFDGARTQAGTPSNVGILYSAAILTGSDPTQYPWNAVTGNFTTSLKGNPVWSTGSSPSNTLAVFPRSNYVSNNNQLIPSADNTAYFYATRANVATQRTRYHFFADRDSLMIVYDSSDFGAVLNHVYNICLLSAFNIHNEISQANPGQMMKSGSDGITRGFLNINTCTSYGGTQDTPFDYSRNGQYAMEYGWPYTNFHNSVGTSNRPGGVLAVLNKGVRVVSNDADTAYVWNDSAGYVWEPNYFASNKVTGRMQHIYSLEPGYQGLIGWLDCPLIRTVYGPTNHDIASDGSKTVFRTMADGVNNAHKFLAPWSGSNPPGTSTNRIGFKFEIHTTSSQFPFQ